MPRPKAAVYQLSGRIGHFPGRQQRSRTVQARQHRARHAAQRRESEFPEHRARHRLVHRSDSERRGLLAAHRFRQREPDERSALRAFGRVWFFALETSRQIAIVDAHASRELFRFNVGTAPQGLAISPDGLTLFVNNFMDRTVGIYDLTDLQTNGQWNVTQLATVAAIASEKLSAQVLLGKQFFYDAANTRLATRPVPELRELPQRRRQRRPHLGFDRHGRRPAQHDYAARHRRKSRVPPLEQEFRRNPGLRGTNPKPCRRYRLDE